MPVLCAINSPVRWFSEPTPGEPIRDRLGCCAADLDQFGHRTDSERRMRRQHVRRLHDQADRLEVLARIVAEIWIETRRGADRGAGCHQQGVAVGRRLRHRAGGDRTSGAAAVVDNDLLAQRLGHFVGDAARHDAGAAARNKRHHQGDRPDRIVLRAGGARGQAEDQGRRSQYCSDHTRLLHFVNCQSGTGDVQYPTPPFRPRVLMSRPISRRHKWGLRRA